VIRALSLVAAAAVVLASCSDAVPPLRLGKNCSGEGSGSCSCKVDNDPNEAACPSELADSVCCAETGYPDPGKSCSCTPSSALGQAKCSKLSSSCSCSMFTTGTATTCGTVSWTSCCQYTNDCTCYATVSCSGTRVTSCSARAGQRCEQSGSICECSATNTAGGTTCGTGPRKLCCFDPKGPSCDCSWGSSSTTCPTGETEVSDCSPGAFDRATLAQAHCKKSSRSVVESCR
jgi:hypothetical protein